MGFLSRLFDPGKDDRAAGIAASREGALRDFNIQGGLFGASRQGQNFNINVDPRLQQVQGQLLQQAGGQQGPNPLFSQFQGASQGIQQGLGQFGIGQNFAGGPFDPNRSISRGLNRAAFQQLGAAQQGIGQIANQQLGLLRDQARPFEQEAMGRLNQQLFGSGQGAVTGSAQQELGGGRLAQAFGRGLGQADVARQLQATGFAQQQQQNQFANARALFGQTQGIQNQGFAQAFQGNQFNAGLLGQQQGINQQIFQAGLGSQQQGFGQQLQALNAATGINQQGLAAFQTGLGAEVARSNAQLGVGGNIQTAAASTPTPFADIVGGLAGGLAQNSTFAFSDERLKDNLMELMDEPATGLKIYSWDWNDEARRVGADKQPPVGLIAQQVQEKFPKAVRTVKGFLAIDYNELHELTGAV
jgi:hypothetical protein